MKKKFTGMYAVAVTPFKENGAFDYERGKNHFDWLISQGIHGICLLGATGEYQSITLEEHKSYVKEMVPYLMDRVPTIVGVTRERPDDVIELINNAKECGADAAMLLPPPYCHPTQNEIIEYFRYVMDKTEFPIMVYNNPSSCGVCIERKTYQELMSLPHTSIIKESSGSLQVLRDVLADAPSHIDVFCGCDNLAFESFADGASGMICMLANVAPQLCVELFDTVFNKHDLKGGLEIYRKLLPGFDTLESFEKPVQALKFILNLKTGNGGFSRRPRLELTEEEEEYIIKAMCIDQIY